MYKIGKGADSVAKDRVLRHLVKVMLFQLRGLGYPQDNTMPDFHLILKALYKGFQMRYYLFQKFYGKVIKIKQTLFS